MSYNTRRTSGGSGFGPSPNAVGQRRPNPQGFQPQGQLTTQNKPIVQQSQQSAPQQQHVQQGQQQQQRIPQQSNQGINFRAQQQNQQGPQGQQQPPPQIQQQPPPQIQQQPPPQIQQQAQIQQMKQQQLAQPKVETEQDESMDTDGTEKKKPSWLNKGVKLSKRERQRRRNIRLRRILQPKNALMILNELVKNPTYTVGEVENPVDNNLYEATVVVNDITHKGFGRSKLAAKTSAAEVALRHVVRYRRINEKQEDTSSTNGATEDESMEVTEDVNAPLPWQHVASFALYKLFCSWGEDPNKQEFVPPKHPSEPKAPKSLPANAAEMNPNQLLNQMIPQVQYEEIGKSGNPPNVLFTIRCTANGENFIGTGRNKKLARKMAAFSACKKLFSVQYPAEVYPGITA